MKIALEPPALLVARLHDPSSRLLHLRKLEPHLDSEARNLNCQARSCENAAKEIGTVEQISLVPEQRNLLPPVLHLRHGAHVIGRLHQHYPKAIGVGVARRQPKEQFGARVSKRRSEHRSDVLRLSPPLADVVDERPDTSQPLVPEAVEVPVHRSLSPDPPWRPEGHRDHKYREGCDPGRASADGDTREQRDDGIQQTERGGEEAVDDGCG